MTHTELANALRAAKQTETDAKNERLRIEQLIVDQFAKPLSNEGTINEDEFSIVYKLNRTVDTDALSHDYEQLPVNAQKAFRWKAEVNMTVLRAVMDLDPEAYSKITKYITSKPAKPSIELKD
jgi:hypothetical protein